MILGYLLAMEQWECEQKRRGGEGDEEEEDLVSEKSFSTVLFLPLTLVCYILLTVIHLISFGRR